MMTKAETVKWLESLKQEIGKTENRSLWHYAEAIDMVIEAMSEPKTGKWVLSHIGTIAEGFYCSRCGKHGYQTDFCSNCGADMRGEGHE